MTDVTDKRLDRDRWLTVMIWVVLIAAAWSLPLVTYVQRVEERAKVESGAYYTPRMPSSFYVVTE